MNERDLRIDFLRGFFIVSLAGTHFSWFAWLAGYESWLRFYDPQPFGFSSPAEFFVFFSGYVMALVLGRGYGKTGYWLTQARTVHRAWTLYVLNVFTMTIVAGCAVFLFSQSPQLAQTTGIDDFTRDPARFLFRCLIFKSNFAFFEILRNYIYFLPLVAPFLALARIHVLLPLSISFAVWLALQTGLLDLLGAPHFVTFNPFGWQFLFFLGASVALIRPLTEWTFPRRGYQIGLCLAVVVIAFVVKMTVFAGITGQNIPLAEKVVVGPLRVLHFLLLLWGAMLILPASSTLAGSRIARALVNVGQNSLECFCLTSILAYLGAHILTYEPHSVTRYFAILLSIFTLMLLSGNLFGWFKSEPWRQRAKKAPPVRETPVREASAPEATPAAAS